jgi:PAS domain S-box-containing protein
VRMDHYATVYINLAHDAILVHDPFSRVIHWNTGAEEPYGWTAQEALGRVTPALLKTRFPVDLAAIEAQLERDGHWEGEVAHTCRDGRPVTVGSRQVLVREDEGQPRAVLEINRDITKRRESEQMVQTVYLETAARLSFMLCSSNSRRCDIRSRYRPRTSNSWPTLILDASSRC